MKVVVGITGASGAIYADLMLERLAELGEQVERVDVVMSEPSRSVWKYELPDYPVERHKDFKFWEPGNFWAPMASGSSSYDAMIVVPCSMGTLGRIASGQANDLISRTADVMLKERRKLILVTRETPLNLIHIRNMETITLAGGIICPGNPSYYKKPDTIRDLALTVVNRALSLTGIDIGVPGFME